MICAPSCQAGITNPRDGERARPALNQGPSDVHSAALATELCTQMLVQSCTWPVNLRVDSTGRLSSNSGCKKMKQLRWLLRRLEACIMDHGISTSIAIPCSPFVCSLLHSCHTVLFGDSYETIATVTILDKVQVGLLWSRRPFCE